MFFFQSHCRRDRPLEVSITLPGDRGALGWVCLAQHWRWPTGLWTRQIDCTTTTWNRFTNSYSHVRIHIHFPTVHTGSSYTFDSCGPTTVCWTSPPDLALHQGSHHCVATSPHRDGCLATPTAAPLELPAPRPWVCEHRPFPAQKTPWIWRVVTTVILLKSWLQENQLL